MYYSIFRNNLLVCKIKPSASSELIQKKQLEDYIRLSFESDIYLDIRIGDYIVYPYTNQKYYINKSPNVKESPKSYTYECIFEGILYNLKKVKAKLKTPKVGGGYYLDHKFTLTGNAQTLLLYVVEVLNDSGYNFTAGKYKNTSITTFNFNNWNILESIIEMSNQLNFDWYIENSVLNFDAKNDVKAYTVQTGRRNGFTSLYKLKSENEDIETVLYGYGGTKNMPPRDADSGLTYDSCLLSENRLCINGVNGESRLENNVNKYGIRENIKEFDEIYPQRVSTLTSVSSSDKRIIYDTAIDFDIEQQKISGITPKIVFLSGKLNGMTFDISYSHSEKKITLDYYVDESGQYPNNVIFAEPGDSYTLIDIILPQQYIDEAIIRLQDAMGSYLLKKSNGLEIYEGQFDEEYIQMNNITLKIGDIIRIVSSAFGIDAQYEIKELTQKITTPSKYTIKFGDVMQKSLLYLLKSNNFNTNQSVYNVSKNTINYNNITNITNQNATEWEQL